ncbi:hypothetical protein Micbo1qcDRAFT_218982, partial [Microdochium bolleyi]
MVVAAICCCGVTVCVVLASELYGWKLHIWDLQSMQVVQGRQVSIASQTIFLFASSFSKLSILANYLRIAIVGTRFWKCTVALIAVVIASILAFLPLLWAQCRPISEYWELPANSRNCISEGEPLLAQTIVTAVTDFLVYILPMPTLWAVRLPRAQRIGHMALLGLGSVLIAAACMRAYWIWYVEFMTYDVTWYGSYLWMWAAVEVNLGVICSSVPAIKPLLVRRSRSESRLRVDIRS